MNINLNFFVSLSKYKPKGCGQNFFNVSCNKGTTIYELLEMYKVPKKEVKMIFINGRHAKFDSILEDGDRVGIFPPVGGG